MAPLTWLNDNTCVLAVKLIYAATSRVTFLIVTKLAADILKVKSPIVYTKGAVIAVATAGRPLICIIYFLFILNQNYWNGYNVGVVEAGIAVTVFVS